MLVFILGVSRGPSPVSLGNQDTLPVAIALTESVNDYFKGADPTKLVFKRCVCVCVRVQGTRDLVVNFESYLLILCRLGFSVTCLLAFCYQI